MTHSGIFLIVFLGVFAVLGQAKPPGAVPLALVYRGQVVGCEGCSEAIASVLEKLKFEVKYVGPNERTKLSPATLKNAMLYAQPGGDGDVGKAETIVTKQLGNPRLLADWVRGGGRYYGTCMGGFLAGRPDRDYPKVSDHPWRGFGLISGTVGEWIVSPGASITHEKDSVVQIVWQGKPRWVFFQDGPHFNLEADDSTKVLAVYKSNQKPAIAVTTLGKGKVALAGPHPEADHTWFTKNRVIDPTDPDGLRGHAIDIAQRLVEMVMEE